MTDGLHARIAEAEHVMAAEIGAAFQACSDAITAAMTKRAETVAAAIAESDKALREITALYHGREAAMPHIADAPPGFEEKFAAGEATAGVAGGGAAMTDTSPAAVARWVDYFRGVGSFGAAKLIEALAAERASVPARLRAMAEQHTGDQRTTLLNAADEFERSAYDHR